LRDAEEIARHLVFVDATFGGEDAADEGRRVAEYLAEWLAAARAQLPWWRRTLDV
jgi:hypothetical protein